MYSLKQVNRLPTSEPSPQLSESTDWGYRQILGVVWRRRYWFIFTFLAIFSVGGFLSLQKEPTYESEMQILVEPNYEVNPERGELSEATENSVEIDYATQLNLMRSSGLLQQAVEGLQGEYPELTIATLRNNLELERVVEDEVETKLFQANYVGDDPRQTQRVLSEILRVYQAYNLEEQRERLTEGLSFTKQQIAIARTRLAEMEANLRNFRTQNRLISPEVNAEALTVRLDAVSEARQEVRATYQGTLARYSALQAQLGRSSPQAVNAARLSESTRYQNLSEQLQANQVALIQERTRFTDASPTVQALLQEGRELSQLRQQEKARLLASQERGVNPQGEQLGRTELNLVEELVVTEAELANLAGQEQSLAQAERQLSEQLNQFPILLAQYDSLQQEIEVQRATLQQLLEAQQELSIEINRGGFNWQVIEPPLTGEQIAPNQKQDLLMAGVVALFVGGIVVYLREMMDKAIYSSEHLQRGTLLPLLGVIPKWNGLPKQGFWSNLIRSENAANLQIFQWRPLRESLDLIYKNIQLFGGQSPPKAITVTSALSGEGKSTLTVGLALSASRLNQRVLVVDSNLRQPHLHQLLNLTQQEGLTDFLQGHLNTPPIHELTVVDATIDLVTAGSPVDDPLKLLSSQRMADLLKAWEEDYDLILVDTPAVRGVADTLQIASCTQGVVLVGGLAQVNETELHQAISLLARFNLLGIIANGTKDNNGGGYGTPMMAKSETFLPPSTNGHHKSPVYQ